MKSKILFASLLLMLCVSMTTVNATEEYSYSGNGFGAFTAHTGGGTATCPHEGLSYNNDYGSTIYLKYISTIYCTYGHSTFLMYYARTGYSYSLAPPGASWYVRGDTGEHDRTLASGYTWSFSTGFYGSPGGAATVAAYTTIYMSDSPIHAYNVTGNVSCVSEVEFYVLSNGTYSLVNGVTDEPSYEFRIVDGIQYRLSFDGDNYDFTCSGDTTYDHNACSYCTINLKDYCGNTMTNTSVDIYSSDAGAPATYEFVGNYHRINPIQLLVTDIGEGKMLDIYFDTDMGAYHQIEYCIEQEVDMLHPLKWWSMTYEAYDVDTELPIENMRVTVNQSCVIDPTHPLKQYLFTGADGKATFIGLSASVLSARQGHPDYMGEAGYTNFDINPFGDAFCTYWSIATYFNKSSGESSQGNVSKDCNIHFKDQNGYIDNHINDTDTYVDLYYDNGNCSATLKFQRLYGTYWMSKTSWNIPINESGYKRIYNVNFSEYDANYRGYMYATECSCNSTMPLYVTNETVQEEQHYENLSTYIRFGHQLGAGQVDYRSPVEIATYAYTNTSAYLLNINLTLYEQTTQIATIALDWADFAGASPKWYYTWAPSVNYDIGKNYTVVMTGYNGLNLGADDVWTSNIRNNKLTIHVKDNHNAPINYATVFIEGWGSQPLESSTDIEITGFDNGDVQYKATKSGYTSSGWATVTFNDGDETVTCVLVKESTTRVTGYKLRNDEIKDFFIPVMYLLLMFMLVGAFFHVAGKR